MFTFTMPSESSLGETKTENGKLKTENGKLSPFTFHLSVSLHSKLYTITLNLPSYIYYRVVRENAG